MLNDILQQTVFQNRIFDYLIFFSIFLIGVILVRMLESVVFRHLKKWAAKTATHIDDFIIEHLEKTVVPLLYFGAFYMGTRGLTLHPNLSRGIDVLGIVLLTIYGARLLIAILTHALEEFWLKQEKDASRQRAIKGLFPVINVLIWGLGIVFLLDNLGFRVSAAIAGLGIGGVAVALAAQAILGDLFSYFAIFFDRPFEIGDFIIVGDFLGSIEHVGIKTTRIRSLGGELLVFSNTDLTNSRVRNYKRMEKRRVVFQLGVTYQTRLEQLKEIPIIIKNVIHQVKDTTFDRAHFFSYGDFSLIFEVVYYVMSSDYNKYMDIQQEINFAINGEFAKRGIEFAYPTQTLYLNKVS